MSEHDQNEWVTVEEAAAMLRLTTRQVNRYGHGDTPRLQTQRVSRRVLYRRQDVLALAGELNVALKSSVAIVPKSEMVPVGEMLEVFERQQQEIGELNRSLGRLEGVVEQQRRQLADVQDVRQRLEAAEVRATLAETEREQVQAKLQEAERTVALLMAPKDEPAPEPPAEPKRRPWWRRWIG